MAKLTKAQVDARLKQAETYLMKRFAGLGYVLLVTVPTDDGAHDIHSNTNIAAPGVCSVARRFADHREKTSQH